jgi:hypothetical protein
VRGHDAVVLVGSVALLSFCIGMGGCATPYQPQGLSGGYSEVRVADDTYLVRVSGNAYASEALLWSYLQRRAREICVEQGSSSWHLENPDSATVSYRSEGGYDVSRTAPDTLTVRERGFRYNKHQVEAVVVCSNQPPSRRPAGRAGGNAEEAPDVEPPKSLE